MKKIPLTKGFETIVDDEDFEWLAPKKWRCNTGGYAVTTTKVGRVTKNHAMHRMIMTPPPGFCVDHKNGNRLDNRRSNLRLATKQQNCANRGPIARNKTGVKGVYRYSETAKWFAAIRVDGKDIKLGFFSDIADAAAAYNEAAIRYFGDFAWLNDIEQIRQRF